MISLLENEQIITVVRKHWFVVLGEFLGIFVAMIAPLFLFFVIEFVPFNVINSNFGLSHVINVLYFFYFFWILIWWISAFYIWTDYYLDEWFITNQRIINIEQKGLFERGIGSLRLDSIQNVSVEIPGLIATMLKIPVGTVRSRLNRGRAQLEKFYKNEVKAHEKI
jgi:signal transduction histidine kinase